MAEESNAKKTHRDEETQGLEKVSDYVEEVDAAPELGQVSVQINSYLLIIMMIAHNTV